MKYIIFAAVVILLAGAALALAKANLRPVSGTYRRRKLMTENEAEFFGRLVNALPDHYIFPQVSMAAVIEPASGDRKQAHSDRLRIAQKRIDFVVCDASCEIVAVVELDDRTHSRAKDQVRDERLGQAGVRTIRFQSRSKPTPEAIRKTILPETAPDASTNENFIESTGKL